ncbi:metal-dependent hydrolase [Erwinia oleae]|uniref:metal-dependent hydrolase n=1 Tax=Erwinia oleae TaxID=796334 RepID=UPI0005581E5C|nr:metal-dependent hydrolase [Erwinia oleae]
MTAEGHLLFAIASTIFARRIELTPELAGGDWWHIVPAALLTCLLPDIDHPKSFLGQRFRWVSQPIARAFGHRGFTHSLLAVLGGVALFQLKVPQNGLVPADVFQGLVLGYLSHIAADMLTPAGVPLLWPCRWRFRLPLLTSQKGNQMERLLCFALIGCAIWAPSFSARSWPADALQMVQSGFSRLINTQYAH